MAEGAGSLWPPAGRWRPSALRRQGAHERPRRGCNGAAIYDFAKKEYLDYALLDETARQRGQEVLDRFPEVAVEAYHIDNVIHGVRPNAFTHQHEHITKVLVTEAPTLLDVPLPLGKLLFEAEHEVLERVQQTPGPGGLGSGL